MRSYRFYVSDYIQEAHHLPDAEDLAYRRLLDLYYLSEAPLIANPEALANHIKLDLSCVKAVLEQFFELTERGYIHPRAELQLAGYRRQQRISKSLRD